MAAIGHHGRVTERPGKGLVLVVEDERPIADLVRMYLARDNFGVHTEADGVAGLAAARRLRPVACVLDIGLPGLDGLEVCRRLRDDGDWTPVVFLTARDDEVDRILGLELGADDYLTKPFSPRELVARVKAVLRRTAGTPDGERVRQVGSVTIDPNRRLVLVDGTSDPDDTDRVRSARAPDEPARPGVLARGAARVGLGVRGARRHPHGRRTRGSGAREAGRGRIDHPNHPRSRLCRRCLIPSQTRPAASRAIRPDRIRPAGMATVGGLADGRRLADPAGKDRGTGRAARADPARADGARSGAGPAVADRPRPPPGPPPGRRGRPVRAAPVQHRG